MPQKFTDSLGYSKQFINAPWWEEVYREAFPDFKSMQLIEDNDSRQQLGIDRIITTPSGKEILVDEKVDSHPPNNFVCEYTNGDTEYPSWLEKDAYTDYIAYAYVKHNACYLFPFQALKRTWLKNKEIWLNTYTTREVTTAHKKGDYKTTICLVPLPVILETIKTSTRINFSTETKSAA